MLWLENPRRVFSQNQDFQKILIKLLNDNDNLKFRNELIALIENMPVNSPLKLDFIQQVQDIRETESFEGWSKIFYLDRLDKVDARTYYMLTLLYDSLILEEAKSYGLFTKEQRMQEHKTRLEFSKAVISKGGFIFLLRLFGSIDKSGIDRDPLVTKILTLLLQIIPHFFSKTLFGFVKEEASQAIDKLHIEAFKLAQSYVSMVVAQQGLPASGEVQMLSSHTKLIELTLTVI